MSSRVAPSFTSSRIAKTADRYSIWVIVFLAILYAISYPIHHAPIFAAIPVILAGWFFRVRGGIIATAAAVVLDLFLVAIFEGNRTWEDILKYESENFFLLGHGFTLLAGWSVGKLREVDDNRIKVETELYSRERYLTLLKLAISDILNPKNPEERYYYLVTRLVNMFVADYGYFLRLDSDPSQAIIVASTLPVYQQASSIPLERGRLIETVLNAETVMPLNHDSASEDIINTTLFKDLAPIRAMLCIPLMAKEYKLGTILLAYTSPRHFTAVEINQARDAGDQIALAGWNIQQEIELQRSLREANALSEIALALSETERIGLDNVLQLIVVSAKELISNVEQAVIHLLNEKEEVLTYGAVVGFDDPGGGKKKMRVGEGIAGQVVLSGETVNITDVRTDPRFLKLDREPTYRSLMVTPVHSGKRKLGTISVSSNLPFAFNAGDIKLLSQLGTQAAIAIENAHLLESTQQGLKEVNALYRINQGLVASLDPQEVLKDAVNLLQMNFGYYHVQIYLRDPENDDFFIQEASGEIGSRLKREGYRLRAGEGIVGYVAETKEAFFTNNVDGVYFFVRNPLLPETKSELTVPVIMDNQITGLLDIQQAPPASLSQRDMQLVSAVADQLAIALQKATLHSDLQAALQVEKAIRNEMLQSERLATMGRLLASVSHELNNPLQAIQNALFLLREEKGLSLQGKLDLDIVLSEAERMSALIERLRTTYRPIQVEDFVPMKVNDIIEDVYALISTHLRHNQITFEFTPDRLLPVIPGLADQMRQVIMNLLMNAVEAMPNGGKLAVQTDFLRDSDEVLLTVSDTGTGIDPELLSNIFDAFVTNKQRGTGLGLTISHDIVMKHHGRITAENNPDYGSTFKVWLPADQEEGV